MSESHLGWFKVEEAAVQKLRDTYDRQSAYRLALGMYVTLCRIANLAGSDCFTRRIASMANDAGLSYNAAAEGLELVVKAGLLTITAKTVADSKERAPSEYRLVRMSPTESGTSPTENGRLPKRRNSQLLPIVSKNSPRTHQELLPREANPKSQQEIYDYLLTLKIEASDALTDAEYLWLHWTENNFTNGGKPIKSWKLTVSKWKAAGFLQSQKRAANHALGNGKKPSGLQDHQTF